MTENKTKTRPPMGGTGRHQKGMQNKTKNYMSQIANSISTDTSPAKKAFTKNFNT